MADRDDRQRSIEQILEDRGIGEGDRASSLLKGEQFAKKLDDDYTFIYNRLKDTKIKEMVRYFQAYMTYKPDDEILDATKSNLVVPKPFEIVRATKAQLSAAIVGKQRPYGRAVGRRPQDRNAHPVTWTIDWQLQENGWEYMIQQILSNTATYGTQPLQVVWDTHTTYNFRTEPILMPNPMSELLPPVVMGERLVTRNGEPQYVKTPVYQGNVIRQIPFDDFGWDLEGTSVNPNFTGGFPCRFVYRRFYATKEELEKQRNEFGEPLYDNLDLLPDLPGENRLTETYAQDKREAAQMPREALRKNQYLCVEFTYPTRIITKVVSEPYLIRNDFNPYGCINYVLPRMVDVDGELLGMSVLRSTEKICRALNNVLDDVMDEFNMEDAKMWIANSDFVDIWANDFRTRPNNVLWTHGNVKPEEAIHALSTKGIAGEGLNLIAVLTRMVQNGAAYGEILSGNPPLGLDTASETITLARAIALVYQGYLKVLDASLGKPLWEMMHRNNQKFMDVEQALKIVGGDGRIIQELVVSPDQQQGEYSWYFEWANKEMMRDLKITQINQLIASLGSIQNWNPLVAELAKMVIEQLQEFSNQGDLQEKLDKTIQMSMIERAIEMETMRMRASGSPKNPANLPSAGAREPARRLGQSQTAGAVHGG